MFRRLIFFSRTMPAVSLISSWFLLALPLVMWLMEQLARKHNIRLGSNIFFIIVKYTKSQDSGLKYCPLCQSLPAQNPYKLACLFPKIIKQRLLRS
jgi:hypothetical protein